ncbi:MAG TPA: hypothetical protein VJH20_01200 [Candidatus Nanoarchaeia archaeon]|nr:hypothetical protein [Candidatus Nanoarchaeia archaeon]
MEEGVTMDTKRLYWGQRLEFLRNAQYLFSSLESIAGSSDDGTAVIAPNDTIPMLRAAFAVAKLESLGKEQLLALEHITSTVSSDSLNSALRTIEQFFLDGVTRFSGDQYKQLANVCLSARHLYEKCYL